MPKCYLEDYNFIEKNFSINKLHKNYYCKHIIRI